MVEAKEIKPVMSVGELAIGIEKRWIARDSLVQQIDCLQKSSSAAIAGQKKIFGARVKIESDDIAGWRALNGQSFRAARFWREAARQSFCAISLWIANTSFKSRSYCLGPDVRVGARVDQLRVETKLRAGPADASLQHVRYTQLVDRSGAYFVCRGIPSRSSG